MIKSLQSIRFILAIGIFIVHLSFLEDTKISGLYKDYLIGLGSYGVTFFIILSGFVITLGYFKKLDGYRNDKFKQFMVKRISNIYPLHIITFILAIFVFFPRLIAKPLEYGFAGILHISLLQTFIPDSRIYGAFNAVSWYLSVCLFFYLITPFLFRIVKRIQSKNINLGLFILGVYTIQLIIVFILKDSSFAYWLFYNSPIFRSFDYFIGVLLGLTYIERRSISKNKINYSILEVLSVILLIAVFYFRTYINVAFLYGTYYTPLIVLTIWVFSFDKGYISKFLSKKPFQYLGSISMEFYMIHLLVITVVTNIVSQSFSVTRIIISFVISFVLSILLSKTVSKIKFNNKTIKLKNTNIKIRHKEI